MLTKRSDIMKTWKKATVITVAAEQLAQHIQVAARSGNCGWGDFR